MRILIKVKPQAKQEKIEQTAKYKFNVWVKEPAKEGRANEAAMKLISRYFKVPKSSISIKKGMKSRDKVVDIF